MVEHQEKLWTFDAVEAGQIGNETTVEITAGNIARYARIALNSDPFYQSDNSDLVAMPTMVMAYAPLLREEIADANGFVAFEVSKTARSQTPFAKCEARWFLPVVPGDVITGRRKVLEKYERRGSKFVTFRVEAINQRARRPLSTTTPAFLSTPRGSELFRPEAMALHLRPLQKHRNHLTLACWNSTRRPSVTF
jgi:hypothetical protein